MTTLPSRVFMNSTSQAIRIPQEFRPDAQRVEITRPPEDDLLIHPIAAQRGDALLAALQAFGSELADELGASVAEELSMQERA